MNLHVQNRKIIEYLFDHRINKIKVLLCCWEVLKSHKNQLL
jgi:hypothetical protein